MMLTLHRSEFFNGDFDLQYRWYLEHAGGEIAERYLTALVESLRQLARRPGLGQPRKSAHPALLDLRSFRVGPPFNVHLVFYRHTESELFAERVIAWRTGPAATIGRAALIGTHVSFPASRL